VWPPAALDVVPSPWPLRAKLWYGAVSEIEEFCMKKRFFLLAPFDVS
jgi:hypothetical protein